MAEINYYESNKKELAEKLNSDNLIFVSEKGKESVKANGKFYDFVPDGGNVGQALIKTENGLDWGEPGLDEKVIDAKIESKIDEALYTEPDTNGYDFVDMGEAGIWATCNIGANSPEEYGLYFAWGETIGYPNGKGDKKFTWENYRFGTQNNLTKYNSIDGLKTLEPEDDAAYVNMGGDWRIPTREEFQALYDACNTIWTTQNGVYGRLFTLKTDSSKQLFFPAAGFVNSIFMDSVGYSGFYWLSSLSTSNNYAYYLYFELSNVNPQSHNTRYYGFSVRGFIPPKIDKYCTKEYTRNNYYSKEEIDKKLNWFEA